jgi:gliding motility-associated-like protein/uncharacterized repeat protein (TIGR01451 family)
MVNLKVSITAFMVLVLHNFTVSAINSAPSNYADQTVTIQQGQSATLHAASVNGVSFQWLKNNQLISGATQNSYVATIAGVYQVMSINASSCTSELSDPVTVVVQQVQTPVADMMIDITSVLTSANMSDPLKYTIVIKNNGPSPATTINVQDNLPNQVQFQQLIQPISGTVNYNDFNKNITWKIDQLESGQTETLNFTVEALKQGAVTNTATVSALQNDPDLSNNTATNTQTIGGLTIPNVFTPNGDGVNDAFEIPGLQTFPVNELTIMNRWGSTVYQKKGYNNDWNGSGLNEGTYFYLLKVQGISGKWDIYKGYVTLLRAKINE